MSDIKMIRNYRRGQWLQNMYRHAVKCVGYSEECGAGEACAKMKNMISHEEKHKGKGCSMCAGIRSFSLLRDADDKHSTLTNGWNSLKGNRELVDKVEEAASYAKISCVISKKTKGLEKNALDATGSKIVAEPKMERLPMMCLVFTGMQFDPKPGFSYKFPEAKKIDNNKNRALKTSYINSAVTTSSVDFDSTDSSTLCFTTDTGTGTTTDTGTGTGTDSALEYTNVNAESAIGVSSVYPSPNVCPKSFFSEADRAQAEAMGLDMSALSALSTQQGNTYTFYDLYGDECESNDLSLAESLASSEPFTTIGNDLSLAESLASSEPFTTIGTFCSNDSNDNYDNYDNYDSHHHESDTHGAGYGGLISACAALPGSGGVAQASVTKGEFYSSHSATCTSTSCVSEVTSGDAAVVDNASCEQCPAQTHLQANAPHTGLLQKICPHNKNGENGETSIPSAFEFEDFGYVLEDTLTLLEEEEEEEKEDSQKEEEVDEVLNAPSTSLLFQTEINVPMKEKESATVIATSGGGKHLQTIMCLNPSIYLDKSRPIGKNTELDLDNVVFGKRSRVQLTQSYATSYATDFDFTSSAPSSPRTLGVSGASWALGLSGSSPTDNDVSYLNTPTKTRLTLSPKATKTAKTTKKKDEDEDEDEEMDEEEENEKSQKKKKVCNDKVFKALALDMLAIPLPALPPPPPGVHLSDEGEEDRFMALYADANIGVDIDVDMGLDIDIMEEQGIDLDFDLHINTDIDTDMNVHVDVGCDGVVQ